MAGVPYDDGVPNTAPDARLPDDYQHVDANPSAFGSLVTQGAQQAGAGATKAVNFFGEVAADNGANQFQDFTTKLMHGDPNKMVQQPDGSMGPDTGYLGLHGRAALDARPQVEQQIDAQLKSIRDGLSTPEQQLQFDNFSKRYRAAVSNQIGEHADTQANTWYQTVNNDSASLALQHAATNVDNPQEFAHGANDYINARVKAAQLAGAQPGDAVWKDTIARAKQDILKTQIQAISVADPARAQRILEKNREIAGTEYEPLANALRARADQANGYAFVDGANGQPGAITKAHAGSGYANPALPAFAQAAAEGGMSPQSLARVVQIESSGNPNAGRGTSHVGLVQAGSSYWERYGQGSPYDPQQAIAALGRSTASDRGYLRMKLGREPTDAELYVAHQQGPGGAEKLLLNPNANAAQLVGRAQVVGNGGNVNMTAQQFVALWTAKFNGVSPYAFAGSGQTMTMPASVSGAAPTAQAPAAAPDEPLPTFAQTPTLASFGQPAPAPPAPPTAPSPDASARTVDNIPAPVSIKADVFAQIQAAEESGQLTHEAAQHARVYASQQLQAQAVAQEQDTRARKALSDQAADGYIKRALAGDFAGLLPAIINDPHLTGEARRSLGEMVEKESSDGSRETVKHYGNGFFDLLKRVTAPAGDPTRIDDPTSLISQVGPGGHLTLSGYERLVSVARQSAKSVDDAAVNRVKTSMLAYANEKLTYTVKSLDPLKPDGRDPKGTMLFNSELVPRLEASYDAWLKAGHSPWDPNSPISKKNVDALIEQIRPQRQKAQDQALEKGGQDTPDAPDDPLPPPPRGVNWNGWAQIVSHPPAGADGAPLSHAKWAGFVNRLVADPSPTAIASFNRYAHTFGYDANEILAALRPPEAARRPEPAPAAAEPAEPATADGVMTEGSYD